MISSRMIIASAIMIMGLYGTSAVAMDIRKFGLEFPHNKQDEHGNTFWHRLVIECDDWSQIELKKIIFKQNNKNWLPNPMIENEEGRTARKEAKIMYCRSGNPLCGLLVMHLNDIEKNYLNQVAVKLNREMMAVAQNYEHPNK